VPTTKCTIGPGNCQKLKDRFIVVQAGISDQFDDTEQKLSEHIAFCDEQAKKYRLQIENMQASLRTERTNLAFATQAQNKAEQGSHAEAQLHDSVGKEYTEFMTACCKDQNDMISELCALGKIKGELNNMNGTKVFITDCEVGKWHPEACNKPCGGGKRINKRPILTHPVGQGGMPCPSLEMEEDCNMEPCPVDCVLSEWGEWSECGASCGGGVMERSRDIEQHPQYDGLPCDKMVDEKACHMGACNKDCVLTDWGPWDSCSRACGTGSTKHTKAIKEEKRGTGKCWASDDDKRLEFDHCNTGSCAALLDEINGIGGNRKVLNCNSKVDVTILLDGSGSLRWSGWTMSQRLASTLIRYLGKNGEVEVALQLFSGPSTWPGVRKCYNDPENVDMENTCKIKWVSHFTDDTEKLATDVMSLSWPASSTLTAVALGMAEAELKNGREGASSVTVVITDGWPLSERLTRQAAERLQAKEEVIWVPIGRRAPLSLVRSFASKPIDEHVLPVTSFNSMYYPSTFYDIVNKIITTTCRNVN